MPSNTTYNPPNIMSFVKSALNFDAQGVKTTAVAGGATNLDYTLVDDCLMTGMELIVNNGNYGDTMALQVIDTTGAFTGVPGAVLMQVASNWNITPTCDMQFDLSYPAKILTGMTLRAIYTSTGSNNVFLAINYKLHKCLI
jgi:hypothetical protein